MRGVSKYYTMAAAAGIDASLVCCTTFTAFLEGRQDWPSAVQHDTVPASWRAPLPKLLWQSRTCAFKQRPESLWRNHACWGLQLVRAHTLGGVGGNARFSELVGHEGCVNRLAFNQTGSLLVSGSDDQTMFVWDVQGAGRSVARLDTGHRANIFGVGFIPNTDDRVLVSGAMDCAVKVHLLDEAGNHRVQHSCTCHTERVKHLAVAPACEGNVFFSASEDGSVRWWDVRTVRPCVERCPNVLFSRRINDQPRSILSLSVHPLAPVYVYTCGEEAAVCEWDRRMGHRPVRLFLSSGHVLIDDVARQWRARQRRWMNSTGTFVACDGVDVLASYSNGPAVRWSLDDSSEPLTLGPVTASAGIASACAAAATSDAGVSASAATENAAASAATHLSARAAQWKAKGNAFVARGSLLQAELAYDQAIACASAEATSGEAAAVLFSNRAAAVLGQTEASRQHAWYALKDAERAVWLCPTYAKGWARLVRCCLRLDDRDGHELALLTARQYLSDSAVAELEQMHGDEEDEDEILPCSQMLSFARAVHRHYVKETVGSVPDLYTTSGWSMQDEVLQRSRSSKLLALSQLAGLAGSNESVVGVSACARTVYRGSHANRLTDIKEAQFFGAHVLCASDTGEIVAYDRSTGRCVGKHQADYGSVLNCIAVSPHGAPLVATSGISSHVRLWHAIGGNLPHSGEDGDGRFYDDIEHADARFVNLEEPDEVHAPGCRQA